MLLCIALPAAAPVTAVAVTAAPVTAVAITAATVVAVVTSSTPACEETAVMAGKNALSNDEDKSSTIPKHTDATICCDTM